MKSLPALYDATISQLQSALVSGEISSVGLVSEHLRRIAAFDRSGPKLNSVPVLNPTLFQDARESDERRSRGGSRGPLEGIPYTVKDSYLTRGLRTAAGSPAFANLIAQSDAFAVARLRAAGAILIGHTNMCPMANGGMHRGLYGRSESPYNPDYLAAGYVSGSSHGSAVSTTSGMGAFGLGEETWSSGRSPASNNALCAYTPSRGVISIRGNWPLTPTMDVVVPQTRSIADLRAILDVLMVDDSETRGDFWRSQEWVSLPDPQSIRPENFESLNHPNSLRGRRIGVPRLYLSSGIEGGIPVSAHSDVIELWGQAKRVLTAAGAEVIELDFPAVEKYRTNPSDPEGLTARGLLPAEFIHREVWDLTAWALDDFLRSNDDPELNTLADADGSLLFPLPQGTIPDSLADYGEPYNLDLSEYVTLVQNGVPHFSEIPTIREGVLGLESTRKIDFEDWMDREELDVVVFPAASGIGREDTERNPESYEYGWRAGVGVSNGGLAIRHYGIPTVTVPVGLARSSSMPIGLTFAGKAYSDCELISYAGAFEQRLAGRVPPPRTPQLPEPKAEISRVELAIQERPRVSLTINRPTHSRPIQVKVTSDAAEVELFVDGQSVLVSRGESGVDRTVQHEIPQDNEPAQGSESPQRIVHALASDTRRGSAAAFIELDGQVTSGRSSETSYLRERELR